MYRPNKAVCKDPDALVSGKVGPASSTPKPPAKIKSEQKDYKLLEQLADDCLRLLKPEFADLGDIDLILGPEREVLKAHSCLLITQCAFFKTRLSPPWEGKAVDLTNLSFEAMKVVLRYIYGTELQIQDCNLDARLDLHEAFKFLLLDGPCEDVKETFHSDLLTDSFEGRLANFQTIIRRGDPESQH
ncbi:hypothetical protein HDV00_011005 [Rhizophlyctis rosea]|nr:hypothetical protein HDV00_011005 [Rhizophlyctis rosea]